MDINPVLRFAVGLAFLTAVHSSFAAEMVAEFDFEEDANGEVVIQQPPPNSAIMFYDAGGKAAASRSHPVNGNRSLALTSPEPHMGAYVDTGINNQMLSASESFSLSLWFLLQRADSNDCLISIAHPETSVFSLTSWAGVLKGAFYSPDGAESATSAPDAKLRPGEWYHLAFVSDAESKTISLFLNGRQVASAPLEVQPLNEHGNWIIGSDRAGSNPASILVDVVRFYRGVLEEEAIERMASDPAL